MRRFPCILLACGLALAESDAFARPAVTEPTGARPCFEAPGSLEDLIVVCETALAAPGLASGTRAELLITLGEMLRDAGRDADAVTRFEAALDLLPGSAAAHEGLGWALRGLDESADAYEAFGAAMGLRAVNSALMGRAATGYDAGVLTAEEAVEMLDAALVQDPDENWARREIGWIWLGDGDAARAAAAFRDALDYDPRDAAAAFGAGQAALDRDRPEEALAHFGLSLDVDPDFAGARTLQIVALRHLGRHEQALKAADRMIRDWPDLGAGYVQRGRALLALERTFEALVTFRYADRQLGPDNAVLYWYADALYLDGRYDEALDAIRRALALEGADHNDHLLMAQIAMDMGNPRLALEAADRALDLHSDDPWGHFYAALAMVRRGAAEEGRRRFEAAIAAGLPRDRIEWFAEELIGAGAADIARELQVAYPD